MEEGAIQFIWELYRRIDAVRKDLYFGSNGEDCSYRLGFILEDIDKEYGEKE